MPDDQNLRFLRSDGVGGAGIPMRPPATRVVRVTGVRPLAFATVLLLPLAPSGVASTNPPFMATCRDVQTHGYRDATDLEGTPMGESWRTDESFDRVWTFVYGGGEHMVIDDERARIVAENPGMLIAVQAGTKGVASSVWSFAVHLGLKRIVASQVTAHGGVGDGTNLPFLSGVEARSVNLTCTFAFQTVRPPPIPSHGEDLVSRAQRRLKIFEFYEGPIDGTLNLETRAALRIFQFAEKLPVTGELDRQTRKALKIE